MDRSHRTGDSSRGGASRRPPPSGVALVDGQAVGAALAPPVQRSEDAAPRAGRSGSDTGGRPLPTELRAAMGRAFEADFSAVRVYEGPSAPAIGASAYTRGSDIHFGPGRYQPGTAAGRALLGHELAHVVQQAQGRVRPNAVIGGVGVNDSPELEREAEEQGARAARGEVVQTRAAGTTGAVTVPVAQRTTEVGNLAYGHGAFMGMALDLLADEKWREILRQLMPDVFREVQADERTARAGGDAAAAATARLIQAFENNPVCAAYGTSVMKKRDGENLNGVSNRLDQIQGFEWDVFLPSRLANAYKAAFRSKKAANREQTLLDLSDEMVEAMLIAHGQKLQLTGEFLGVSRYGGVLDTPKTKTGGVRSHAWMDLFGRALFMAHGVRDGEGLAQHDEILSGLERVTDGPAADRDTFANKWSFAQTIAVYRHYFGRAREFSVILDIKSSVVDVHVVNALVGALNRRGVHVAGVGSFEREVNDQERLLPQSLPARTGDPTATPRALPAPRQYRFAHGFGNVLKAVRSGQVREGDHFLFNGAALLDPEAERQHGVIMAKYQHVEKIRVLAEFLELGVYVQETNMSPGAFRALKNFVNEHHDLFSLGFAWGGPADYEDHDSSVTGRGWGGQRAIRKKASALEAETVTSLRQLLRTKLNRSAFQRL